MRSVFDNALGRGGNSGGELCGHAAPGRLLDSCAAMPLKAPSYLPSWTLWGAGYGGTVRAGGDAATGSYDTTSRVAGAAAGATYQLAPDRTPGVSRWSASQMSR